MCLSIKVKVALSAVNESEFLRLNTRVYFLSGHSLIGYHLGTWAEGSSAVFNM